MIPRRALGLAAAAALAAVGVSVVFGHVSVGLALSVGLLLGAGNGLVAERALGWGLDFRVTSLGRMALLSALALGVGLLLGGSSAWLVIVGVAASQVLLATAAFSEAIRR